MDFASRLRRIQIAFSEMATGSGVSGNGTGNWKGSVCSFPGGRGGVKLVRKKNVFRFLRHGNVERILIFQVFISITS